MVWHGRHTTASADGWQDEGPRRPPTQRTNRTEQGHLGRHAPVQRAEGAPYTSLRRSESGVAAHGAQHAIHRPERWQPGAAIRQSLLEARRRAADFVVPASIERPIISGSACWSPGAKLAKSV